MIELFYGTANPAKYDFMYGMLKELPIGLTKPPDSMPAPEENGSSVVENARIKALYYYERLNKPVFSCDAGLYLTGVPASLQPGIHARRPQGVVLNDDEMIDYYSDLAKKYGSKSRLRACYRNAICLVMDEQNVHEYSGDDISSTPFLIADFPHATRVEGWPLDSLSICEQTGSYFFDMPTEDRGLYTRDISPGFRNFFMRVLSLPGVE